MRRIYFVILFCLTQLHLYANDGAFFASGNQLIPINESDISVKREILTIKKIRHDFIEVSVYYEFFNPKEEKEMIIGFEALSPYGDVNGAPNKYGEHPYMKDFTVAMNSEILKYKVAYVADSLYRNKDSLVSIDLENFEGNKSGNWIDFYYVYHFKARMKKGLNIIKHTYTYKLSGGICYNYHFEYVLTAANRWANKQIDDFTLIIDSGEYESFNIKRTFFKNHNDWIINGIGKSNNALLEKDSVAEFHIQKGPIIFNAKSFSPVGELYVYSINCDFGRNKVDLPFSYFACNHLTAQSDFMKRVFKNLPFARRGYVFKDKELQEYFQENDWYMPNPNYKPDVHDLHPLEQKFIEQNK